MQIVSHSQKETAAAGAALARRLAAGDVVAFFGGLGAGKTSFIAGMAEGLGVTDPVSSPTFALVHEYRGPVPLYHFDMYRVTNEDDLFSTGFFDYLDSGGICTVEWSENIEGALPTETVRVSIEYGTGENDRMITIEGKGRGSNENSRG
ncbi:MAG: tRNA (adenosine(37)-N6)-threonylcarbamoyltransferase complex ATPase subunit type 1 TsaE [Clostridia bacterium]|nr:tRNA (adenosine(37)-N6)-threonylcarbamoyltransferase complex ATPase subunit type 1 TsaE [Clostridia bacterium]